MPPRQRLEEAIDHLRHELASGAPLTAADRALLDRTLAEAASRLAADRSPALSPLPLDDELRELAARVEKTRPNLSILLGRIVDALAQLGI